MGSGSGLGSGLGLGLGLGSGSGLGIIAGACLAKEGVEPLRDHEELPADFTL